MNYYRQRHVCKQNGDATSANSSPSISTSFTRIYSSGWIDLHTVVVRYVLDETRTIITATLCKLANFPRCNIKSDETWLDIAEATFALVLHARFSFSLSLSSSFTTSLHWIFPRRVKTAPVVSPAGDIHSSVALIALYARLTPFNPLYKRMSC